MKKLLLLSTLLLVSSAFAVEEVIVAPFVRNDKDELEINLDSLKDAQKIKAGEQKAFETKENKIYLDTELIKQQYAVDYATNQPGSGRFPL